MSKRPHLQHDQTLKGYYAGFVSRLVAFVIDISVLTFTLIVLGWVISVILDFFGLSPSTTNLNAPNITMRDYIANTITIILVISIPFLTFCIWVIYYVGSWVLMGQTIGKQLLGLKVVSIDGSPVSIKRGIIRYFGYWVSAIPLFAGYWWVLLDDERRGWHDRLSHTCVIYVWDARTGTRLRDLLLNRFREDQQDSQAI